MTLQYHRKEVESILRQVEEIRTLLNSEENIKGNSGLWLSNRVERTNEALDSLISDLECQVGI